MTNHPESFASATYWANPPLQAALERARTELDTAHRVDRPCGCVTYYTTGGRDIGGWGPAGCDHPDQERHLGDQYRRRQKARRRRNRR